MPELTLIEMRQMPVFMTLALVGGGGTVLLEFEKGILCCYYGSQLTIRLFETEKLLKLALFNKFDGWF